MRYSFCAALVTAISAWSLAVGADAPKDTAKKLNFKWTIEVRHPDRSTTTLNVAPDVNQIAMKSTDWECFSAVKLGQSVSRETGSISCFYAHGTASASTGTSCADGETMNYAKLIVTEKEVDGTKKEHVLILNCARMPSGS